VRYSFLYNIAKNVDFIDVLLKTQFVSLYNIIDLYDIMSD